MSFKFRETYGRALSRAVRVCVLVRGNYTKCKFCIIEGSEKVYIDNLCVPFFSGHSILKKH